MSTDQQTNDIFSKWLNLQQSMSEQWSNVFQQMNSSSMPSFEKSLEDFSFINPSQLFNQWQELFKKAFSSQAGSSDISDVLQRIMNASQFFVALNGFWQNAVQDIPDITKAAGNQNKLDEIYEKWVIDYKKILDPILGSSSTKNIEAYLESFFKIAQINQQTMGLFYNPFLNTMPQWQSYLDLASKGEREGLNGIHELVRNTYNETIGRLFRVPGFGLTKAQTEEIRQAYDALNQFLTSIPNFNQHLYNTALDAMKDVFGQVKNLQVEELTPETMRELYTIWWKTNEKQFYTLFQSADFSKSMNEVVGQGFYLKQRIDVITGEWCKIMSIPSLKEFDEMALTIHELRKKVRLQQKAIEELQQRNPATE